MPRPVQRPMWISTRQRTTPSPSTDRIKSLRGVLDANFGTGITLQVLLAAPTGATAAQKTLGTTSQDLVTSIGHVAESSLTITFTASATVAAAPNGAGVSRTLTFTLTDI